ncbi:hypothetical protein PanWU01x14_080800 [Parasponia andersonii]|uniref:Disease resistance N-terminal domain-containing protein n=1 Tax=Parasponia andersonii TaxID=3476 RepID=A0A2P5DAV2_PARAD|nr:hypothetical protein PanWU01x14_080800 [Parasponia andersonii]
MANLVLSGVANKIIGLLGSQAAQEIGLFLGVTGEIEGLKGTLSMIKDRLRDTEKKKNGSETVKNWLARLEDVLEEVDELSTQDLRGKLMLGDHKKITEKLLTFFSSSNVAFRLKMARKEETK